MKGKFDLNVERGIDLVSHSPDRAEHRQWIDPDGENSCTSRCGHIDFEHCQCVRAMNRCGRDLSMHVCWSVPMHDHRRSLHNHSKIPKDDRSTIEDDFSVVDRAVDAKVFSLHRVTLVISRSVYRRSLSSFAFLSPHALDRVVLALWSLLDAEGVRLRLVFFLWQLLPNKNGSPVVCSVRLMLLLLILGTSHCCVRRNEGISKAASRGSWESQFYHLRGFNRVMLQFEDIFRVCQCVRMRICRLLNWLRCEWI